MVDLLFKRQAPPVRLHLVGGGGITIYQKGWRVVLHSWYEGLFLVFQAEPADHSVVHLPILFSHIDIAIAILVVLVLFDINIAILYFCTKRLSS